MIKELMGAAVEQLAPTGRHELDQLSSRDDLSDAIPDFKVDQLPEVDLDDNGLVYKINGELQPNCEYQINGYTYRTDQLGRVIEASGNLHLTGEPRQPLTQENVGGKDKRPTDDRGHLIADRFGGSNKIENLVAQDSNLNRGEYKAIENTCARALEEGKKVSLKVEVEYDGVSQRPSAFIVTYQIDGVTYEKVLLNKKAGE